MLNFQCSHDLNYGILEILEIQLSSISALNESHKKKNNLPSVQHGRGPVRLGSCFAASGTGGIESIKLTIKS